MCTLFSSGLNFDFSKNSIGSPLFSPSPLSSPLPPSPSPLHPSPPDFRLSHFVHDNLLATTTATDSHCWGNTNPTNVHFKDNQLQLKLSD